MIGVDPRCPTSIWWTCRDGFKGAVPIAVAMEDWGEHDYDSPIDIWGVFRLVDGRYAYIEGQSEVTWLNGGLGGVVEFAATIEDLIPRMSNEGRSRLQITEAVYDDTVCTYNVSGSPRAVMSRKAYEYLGTAPARTIPATSILDSFLAKHPPREGLLAQHWRPRFGGNARDRRRARRRLARFLG
jgi:hypothetical protein